jgi:uncharacterized protein (TIGR03435 family)
MLAHLTDVSIRSLLLALMAAALEWMLRSKRTAALQHAIWASVVCGMLALFAFGQALPRLPLRVLDHPARAPLQSTLPIVAITPPVPDGVATAVPIPTKPHPWIDWIRIAAYAYAAIAFLFLARFVTGMFFIRKLLTTASAQSGTGFLESELIAVPLSVGWLWPKVLLPLAWMEWDREKLDAVLAHEGAHVRRRDGLVAALAGMNRCIFWFHPLAWWLERRLTLLAELACDESCVAELGNPEQYARLLLDMALVVDGSQGRLRQHVLTMAAASHIRQRIDLILKEGRKPSRGLTGTGWAAIALCGVPVVLSAGAVTLDRRVLAQVQTKVQFEVASIRLSVPTPPSEPVAGGRGGGGAGGSCMDRFTMDAGRIDVRCLSLQALIAYSLRFPQKRVTGPDWIAGRGALLFDIAAKLPEGAAENQAPEMMRALLEDRFKLAVHRGSREETVYGLVAAKGGLKLKEAAPGADAPPAADSGAAPANVVRIGDDMQARMTQFPDGSQVTSSPLTGTVRWTLNDGVSRLDAPSTTLEGLAAVLGQTIGQQVTDMTGLGGRYQVTLESSAAEVVAAGQAALADAQAGGTTSLADAIRSAQLNAVRNALQKLGLQLESRKGSVETIVVDHVEKTPTDN